MGVRGGMCVSMFENGEFVLFMVVCGNTKAFLTCLCVSCAWRALLYRLLKLGASAQRVRNYSLITHIDLKFVYHCPQDSLFSLACYE